MSETIDSLNEAQKGQHSSHTNLGWIIGLILCIVLFTNLGITLRLLVMMKNYTSANAFQINTFSADFEKMNANLNALSLRTQDSNARITQLEKEDNIKSAAIDNLTKAKNTLFNRLSSIEAKQAEARTSP